MNKRQKKKLERRRNAVFGHIIPHSMLKGAKRYSKLGEDVFYHRDKETKKIYLVDGPNVL